MDVSIVGAGGNVGRHIVLGLIQQRIIGPSDRLQIVGNREGRSGMLVRLMRQDLLDAYAEYLPEIDVAEALEEVVGDIIVMAAGKGATPEHPERDFLAKANLPIFRALGEHLCTRGSGRELVLVLTNPVELGTLVIARELEDETRVIGMGSYLDSHRFRKELAIRWGLYHGDVDAMMLGEHGPRCLPVWSSVTVRGRDRDYVDAKIAELRMTLPEFRAARMSTVDAIKPHIAPGPPDIAAALHALKEFSPDIAAAQRALSGSAPDIPAALRILDCSAPDIRAVVLPMICQASGAKTAVGTADKTCRLLRCIVEGRKEQVPIQACLSGDMRLGYDTCVGVPAMLSMSGISRQPVLEELDADELTGLREVATILGRELDETMRAQ